MFLHFLVPRFTSSHCLATFIFLTVINSIQVTLENSMFYIKWIKQGKQKKTCRWKLASHHAVASLTYVSFHPIKNEIFDWMRFSWIYLWRIQNQYLWHKNPMISCISNPCRLYGKFLYHSLDCQLLYIHTSPTTGTRNKNIHNVIINYWAEGCLEIKLMHIVKL